MRLATASLSLLLIAGANAFSAPFGLKKQQISTNLYGRKKGGLGKIGSTGVTTKAKKNSKKKNKVKEESPKVSSSLSEWASSLDGSNVSVNDKTGTDAVISSSDSSTFKPFEEFASPKKSNSRRDRSGTRAEKDRAKNQQIDSILLDITTRISSNNFSIEALLDDIKTLIKVQPASTFKSLLKSNLKNYNLAWVGSDDCICHVGTGLHKVPLARLQDIFLSVGRDGSGQAKTVTLLEVISIFGPFPNVRNTLQGSIMEEKSTEREVMGASITENKVKFMYDSMFDGLGKEISAGKEDNVRYVDLNILYADEKALVCVVPSDNSKGIDDEFGDNGENVLLFLKEDDLDLKLDQLRAS
jgi:hypothetical protein